MKYRLTTTTSTSPTKGYINDAGWDLHAVSDVVIKVGETLVLNTGLKLEIPSGYCGIISERSSQGLVGIHTIGNIIDSSYRGEIHVVIQNNGSEDYHIQLGDKFAQLIIVKIYDGNIVESNSLLPSSRGSKGFGSTGA